jgi:hypothetical protein
MIYDCVFSTRLKVGLGKNTCPGLARLDTSKPIAEAGKGGQRKVHRAEGKNSLEQTTISLNNCLMIRVEIKCLVPACVQFLQDSCAHPAGCLDYHMRQSLSHIDTTSSYLFFITSRVTPGMAPLVGPPNLKPHLLFVIL